MKHLYSMTLEQLENYFTAYGDKKFRATQVFEWLYRKRVTSFEQMTNLKKEVIDQLKKDFNLNQITILEQQKGQDVYKFLFELEDHQKIEAVVMIHDYGTSLCVSSQVGCNMGCTFCESGRLKKIRNLETWEMVEQVLMVEQTLNIKITHVVLMGIGEPFDNYDHVMDFISILNEPKGIELGSRHITVSTCGIIPKIKTFMESGKQVNLAISLHAPNDEIRNQLMPISKTYPISELIQVIKEYIKKTNRRVTFEYILLQGINDTETCALELSHLLKGMNCYVNLIPYNETSYIQLKKSSKETILTFFDILKKQHIQVTIRKEFGSAVSAACGQLRSHYEEEQEWNMPI